ncbi:39S ribosomal protein L41-A, mitochondrial-like [Bufo gargarizans]|uniref:39S ribosomal protein L41, mitochondrial n=1 Tax=Bufo gargarizans TaxID=30331 RepID=UPI001CF3F074|nr:39S ribosomal protein L41, mitochondrial [Bufo gargarizans]XP_044128148.1 39S ribosomal protein L41-A, mitochondrial-like [Bufo gargarizans]
MGLLQNLARGFVRGSDRMAKITSKMGPNSFNRGRGAKRVGFLTSNKKFVRVKEMVPEFIVPDLSGFKLRPYVSYKVPAVTEEKMTAKKLFLETAAPAIQKDIESGTFDPNNLEKYGFEPTQEGKLFQLYPKNYVQ